MPDRIRLAAIDAPELKRIPHPGAIAARDHLRALTANQVLRIVPVHAWPDRYGRMVARVFNQHCQDVNLAMVTDGFATYFSLRERKNRIKDCIMT